MDIKHRVKAQQSTAQRSAAQHSGPDVGCWMDGRAAQGAARWLGVLGGEAVGRLCGLWRLRRAFGDWKGSAEGDLAVEEESDERGEEVSCVLRPSPLCATLRDSALPSAALGLPFAHLLSSPPSGFQIRLSKKPDSLRSEE